MGFFSKIKKALGGGKKRKPAPAPLVQLSRRADKVGNDDRVGNGVSRQGASAYIARLDEEDELEKLGSSDKLGNPGGRHGRSF